MNLVSKTLKTRKTVVFAVPAAALLSLAMPAFADEVRVAIPRTQISIQSEEFVPVVRPAQPMRAEAFTTSYSPSGFRVPSRLAETSDLKRSSVPQVGVAFMTRSFAQEGLFSQVSARFALSAISFRRTGQLTYLGTRASFEQETYLIPLEAGLAFNPRSLSFNLRAVTFQPYFELAAQPIVLFTSRSVMDDGKSYAALLGKGRAGIGASLPRSIWSFTVGADQTVGSMQGSSLTATHFSAAIRADLE